MVNTSISTLTKAEDVSKGNKATKVVQLRMDNPTMTNVNVAKTVGCSQTYSSKIWSDYMKAKGNATKTQSKTKSAAPAKAKKRITAARKATTTAPSATTHSAEQILTAYDDMKCLVNRVGPCAATHLLKRAEKELS
tara:strand:+ start:340 stop:747 length:408 start_codon:yes stop_codon:yes gene_type:complete